MSTTMLAGMMQDEIRARLDTLNDELGQSNDVDKIKEYTTEFFDNFGTVAPALQKIAEAEDFNDEWKAKKQVETVDKFKHTQNDLAKNVAWYLNNLQTNLRAKATPRPIAEDAATREARLQSARPDARMMLENVDNKDLIARMTELAGRGDDALAHLLLATPWAGHYLTSRGAQGFIPEWEAAKIPHLKHAYEGEAVTAVQRLIQSEKLETLADDLRFILESWQAPRVL